MITLLYVTKVFHLVAKEHLENEELFWVQKRYMFAWYVYIFIQVWVATLMDQGGWLGWAMWSIRPFCLCL